MPELLSLLSELADADACHQGIGVRRFVPPIGYRIEIAI